MRFIDEQEIKSTEALSDNETTEETAAPEENTAAVKKKKKHFIQAPVIISLCLVVASLLAFFAYKTFWISEPEGVIWKYVVEDDNDNEDDDVVWYYEFKDDNVFKVYLGESLEVTAKYKKEKKDDVKQLTILPAELNKTLGCMPFGTPMDYEVTGSRLTGDQKLNLSYTDYTYYYYTGQSEDMEFSLTQAKKDELKIGPDPDPDFVVNDALTGEWINQASTDIEYQSFIFDDDGSMRIVTTSQFYDGVEIEICYHCSYLVSDDELSLTINTFGTNTELYNYKIKGDYLYLDDLIFYREGADPNGATADEIK